MIAVYCGSLVEEFEEDLIQLLLERVDARKIQGVLCIDTAQICGLKHISVHESAQLRLAQEATRHGLGKDRQARRRAKKKKKSPGGKKRGLKPILSLKYSGQDDMW